MLTSCCYLFLSLCEDLLPGASSNYNHYRGFSLTNCDGNKDFVHMPLRIPAKYILIVSIVKALSERVSALSLTFSALSMILQ